MKKLIIATVFAACGMSAFAQENMMSKRGTPILPEVGDYGVSFDAEPFFYYLGNMFNQNGNTAPRAEFTYNNPFTVTGFYWYEANKAYRGRVRLGFGSAKQDTIVLLNGQNPNELTTTNTTKEGGSNVTLGLGKQRTIGKGRLRGNYGGEASIMFGTQKNTYDYGQALSDSNDVGPRPLEIKQGTKFGIGVRAFVSVEYFFAPKISVSAQYGWGIALTSTGKGKDKYEDLDTSGSSSVVVTKTVETGKSSFFGADVDNNGGSINLTFYF